MTAAFDAARYPLAWHLPAVTAEQDASRHAPVLGRLLELIERGQESGDLDATLPPGWLLIACLALGRAAEEEVKAGRMTIDEATRAVYSSFLRLLGLRRRECTAGPSVRDPASPYGARASSGQKLPGCMHACHHDCMEQMTWRAPADLIERVRRAAQRQHRSMNDYVTAVLDAATNPSLASSEAERLRQRLDQAGLLAEPGKPRRRPSRDETDRARSRAGRGTSLSELVSQDR